MIEPSSDESESPASEVVEVPKEEVVPAEMPEEEEPPGRSKLNASQPFPEL